LLFRPPPRATPFPYTTLFRSGRVQQPLRLAVADHRGAADDPRYEPRAMWRRQRRVYRPDVRPDRGVPLLVVYYQRQQPLQRVVREFLRWVRELRHQDRQLLRPRGAGRLVIDHSASRPARTSTTSRGSWGTPRRSSRSTPTGGGSRRARRRRDTPSRAEVVTNRGSKR